MGKVISIINMKGGVGKTTLSLGISEQLANMGKKVLLIDVDPQFNSTQAMLDLYKEEHFYTSHVFNEEKTIYKLFKPQTSVIEEYKEPKLQDLVVPLKTNLDLLCGDLNLVLVNKINDHSIVRRLKNFISCNNIKNIYDFVIIDCPPTLTIYTDSALMASDFYLIPNKIDRYSIVGIGSLQKAIQNLIREEGIKLKCLGLVYTMVQPTLAKQRKLRTDFESKKEVNSIDIFSAEMSVVNHVSNGASGSVPTLYKSSKQDIEAITIELLDRIENFEE